MPTIYNPKTTSSHLRTLAKEFITDIRPLKSENQECDSALARYEMHEGIAHFVGTLALLKTELAAEDFLAKIDQKILKVPHDVHSVMYVYATGGGISMLLYRLLGNSWYKKVEAGQTPFEILRSTIENEYAK